MAVKAKDTPVAAMATAMATAPAGAEVTKKRRPYFSEGMRHDLETLGWTVDPTTGKKLTEDPRSA